MELRGGGQRCEGRRHSCTDATGTGRASIWVAAPFHPVTWRREAASKLTKQITTPEPQMRQSVTAECYGLHCLFKSMLGGLWSLTKEACVGSKAS